jgi:hypothetical protein
MRDETVVLIPRNLDGVEPGVGDPLVRGESDMTAIVIIFLMRSVQRTPMLSGICRDICGWLAACHGK